MTQTTTGWVVFLAAVAMMFGLLAVDLVSLKDWSAISTPIFVGTFIGHISSVIGAFIGGKLIPTERDTNMRTRASDKVSEAIVNEVKK